MDLSHSFVLLAAASLSGCATTSGLMRLPNGYVAPLPVAEVVLSGAAYESGVELVLEQRGFSFQPSYWRDNKIPCAHFRRI